MRIRLAVTVTETVMGSRGDARDGEGHSRLNPVPSTRDPRRRRD